MLLIILGSKIYKNRNISISCSRSNVRSTQNSVWYVSIIFENWCDQRTFISCSSCKRSMFFSHLYILSHTISIHIFYLTLFLLSFLVVLFYSYFHISLHSFMPPSAPSSYPLHAPPSHPFFTPPSHPSSLHFRSTFTPTTKYFLYYM